MFSYLKNWKEFRSYQAKVDDWLILLFCGFPDGSVGKLKSKINMKELVRGMYSDKVSAEDCSLYATRLLIRKLISPTTEEDKKETLDALERQDASNPMYKGFDYMGQILEQMVEKHKVKPIFVRLIGCQFLGSLRNMTQEEIDNWWGEIEIQDVVKLIQTEPY